MSQLRSVNQKARRSIKCRIDRDRMSQKVEEAEPTENDIVEDTDLISGNAVEMESLFDLDQPQVYIVQDELKPQVGEYWKVRNGRDYLFAIVTSEVPLEVRYFEPCVKKG